MRYINLARLPYLKPNPASHRPPLRVACGFLETRANRFFRETETEIPSRLPQALQVKRQKRDRSSRIQIGRLQQLGIADAGQVEYALSRLIHQGIDASGGRGILRGGNPKAPPITPAKTPKNDFCANFPLQYQLVSIIQTLNGNEPDQRTYLGRSERIVLGPRLWRHDRGCDL